MNKRIHIYNMISRIILLICVFASVTAQKMIDKRETPDELAELFPLASNGVSDYEIVPVHFQQRKKRGVHEYAHVTTKAFGKDIKLWLNPPDGILASTDTPIFTIRKNGKMFRYSKLMKKVLTKMYEDNKKAATLIMKKRRNGRVEFNGIIGADNIHLRSVPQKFLKILDKYIKNDKYIPESISGNFTYHIAYKLVDPPNYMKTLPPPILKNGTRSSRQTLKTIYPEIMPVIDYPLFKLFRRSLHDTVAYSLGFWNGVDLMYRSLQEPNYRLNLAGIIISTDPEGLNYVQHTKSPRYVMDDQTLDLFGTWAVKVEKTLPKNRFDVAITMTSETLCAVDTRKNLCRKGPLGVAFVTGACSPAQQVMSMGRVVSKTYKVGLIYDNSGFGGIHTAAHELGHLFGADHDGEKSQQCNQNSGNVMAPVISFEEQSKKWSYCSQQDFQKFIDNQGAHCLYNKPRSMSNVRRYLPGKLMTASRQCKNSFGDSADVYKGSTCTKLLCVRGEWVYSTNIADGTPCDSGKMCLYGYCIRDPYV